MHKVKKYLTLMVCMIFLLIPSTVKADTTYTDKLSGYELYIHDEADYFTDEEEKSLESVMKEITSYCNVVVGTTEYHSYRSSDAYAESLYTSYFRESEPGVIFVIDRDLNNIWLSAYGRTQNTLTSSRCDVICDNTYIYASASYNRDYFTCCLKTLEQVKIVLEGGKISQPMKYISNALIAFIIGMLICFVLVFRFSRQKKPKDNELLRNIYSNVHVDNPTATLINTTRHYSPRSSGGSGGGSSRGGGGGSSSSGGGGGGGHSGGGHSI